MDLLNGIAQLQPAQISPPPMPAQAFGRARGARHPVLTIAMTPAGESYLGDRPDIRLSRMTIARDMIEHLGVHIFNEGVFNPSSGKTVAWIRYDLPAREDPFAYKIRKTYGGPRRSEMDAWESLGSKLIQEIMQETGYNVDDVNFRFCNVACSRFAELYRIAGGSTLMAQCARETARAATQSLDQVMNKLSRMLIEYNDVLPFSMVIKKLASDHPLSGRLEEFVGDLVSLSKGEGDEPGLDEIDYRTCVLRQRDWAGGRHMCVLGTEADCAATM